MFSIPLIKSVASKRCTYIVAVILLFSEIMSIDSRCVLKWLVYIAIIAPLGRQPFFCVKYTKLNIRLFCNIRLVFNAECIYLYVLRFYKVCDFFI